MPKNRTNEAESFVAVEEVQEIEQDAVPEVEAPPILDSIAVPKDFFVQLLSTMQEMANNQTKALARVIEEIRKPVHDEIKEKQAERAKATQQASQKAFWATLEHRALNCSHLRENGSSCIAWAEQSDTYGDYPDLCEKNQLFPRGITGASLQAHIKRGACQHCQTLFSPRREECVCEEIWLKYHDLLRIPSGMGQGVNWIAN